MKVFLGSVVAYQLVYWIWAKLETDEIKDKKISEHSQGSATHTIGNQLRNRSRKNTRFES